MLAVRFSASQCRVEESVGQVTNSFRPACATPISRCGARFSATRWSRRTTKRRCSPLQLSGLGRSTENIPAAVGLSGSVASVSSKALRISICHSAGVLCHFTPWSSTSPASVRMPPGCGSAGPPVKATFGPPESCGNSPRHRARCSPARNKQTHRRSRSTRASGGRSIRATPAVNCGCVGTNEPAIQKSPVRLARSSGAVVLSGFLPPQMTACSLPTQATVARSLTISRRFNGSTWDWSALSTQTT